MASTTYNDFVDVNKIAAIHGCFLDLTKTYHLGDTTEMVTFCHHFASIGNMVRNAGQLPQPFWLGAACGGGSCGAATVPARA